MIFEDAHWADPSSIELLDQTITRVRRMPVLAVVTFRPDFPALDRTDASDFADAEPPHAQEFGGTSSANRRRRDD